jgi:hypothetical protein
MVYLLRSHVKKQLKGIIKIKGEKAKDIQVAFLACK